MLRRYNRWNVIGLVGPILLLMCVTVFAEDSSVPNEDFDISLWNYSAEFRGGFGYKDNVLLSHTNAQGSAFWESGLELMAFRLPAAGWQFTFFADASDTRYFNSPSVNSEQFALAAAQLVKDFGSGWKSTFSLNYVYQNQVFDYSELYTNQSSVGQIVGHSVVPRWAMRKAIGAFWLEGEFSGTRQWLEQPLDNYWSYGPRATAGYGWGNGSELGLSYQYSHLAYDSREQVNQLGESIPDTLLALDSHLIELAATYIWDEKSRWRTVTGIGYESTRDNGSGFYDYDSYHLSQQVRYRDDNWEVTARVRLNYSDYSSQTVSATDPSLRRKTMVNVTLGAERRLMKHLKARAGYEWNRSISNLDFDDYSANTVWGSLALTF